MLEVPKTTIWFSGKEIIRGKQLKEYIGKNEKTKIILKLQKTGQGAPQREPVMSEEERKAMMLHAYRRQEELKVKFTNFHQIFKNHHKHTLTLFL